MIEAIRETVEQTEQPMQLSSIHDVLENSRRRHHSEEPHEIEDEDMQLYEHIIGELRGITLLS